MQQISKSKQLKILDILGTNSGAWKSFLQSMNLDFEFLKPREIKPGCTVLLPGVSSAKYYFAELEILRPLFENRSISVFGVCAGFQALCGYNEESKSHGFNFIEADVKELSPKKSFLNTGWMNIGADEFFFNHSYGVFPAEDFKWNSYTNTETMDCLGQVYLAEIRADKFVGVQYHPELSGEQGQRKFRELLGELDG